MPTHLTQNFALEELACRDGTPVPKEFHANALDICIRAQKLRTLLGSGLNVTSGYRTQAHNTKVGGAKNSAHLTASALDLSSPKWDADLLGVMYEGLIRLGVVPDGGLGVYRRASGGWIHIDLHKPRRWFG